MCATVVSEMFAERRHTGVGAVGHYRIRSAGENPSPWGKLAGLVGTGVAPVDQPEHTDSTGACPGMSPRVSITMSGRFESSPAVSLTAQLGPLTQMRGSHRPRCGISSPRRGRKRRQ